MLFTRLIELFQRFPGIGPRQANRFAFFLARQHPRYIDELIAEIQRTRKNVRQCTESFQLFFSDNPDETTAPLVRNPDRNKQQLMIVANDMDIDAIEKAHVYRGQYFVLGRLISLIKDDEKSEQRIAKLQHLTQARAENDHLEEIIFALPVNPEGEHTRMYLTEKLKDLAETFHLTMSTLGRGLSTGTELEYVDADTFESAFQGRG